MNEAEKQKIISELKNFYKKLRNYQIRQRRRSKIGFSESQDRNLNALRLELQREHGRLANIISEYGGTAYLPVPVLGEKYEVFGLSLGSLNMKFHGLDALDGALSLVNHAIGKLESTPIAELEVQEVSVTQELKDTREVPNSLFDKMQFHPRVIEVSKSLFVDGYYKQAILEAYIALNNLVKDKAGSPLDGKALMAEVFSEKTPIIKLNDLLDRNDKDEQEGFRFLYMGAIVGVRNPKAHDNIVQSDPYRTLEYLSLVSLLMKRVDEGKVVKL